MASCESIRLVENILRTDKERRFVVVSAPGKRFDGDEKVTDLLITAKRLHDEGEDFCPVLKKLQERFCELERELGVSIDAARELEIIARNMIDGESIDYVASRGEYLSAKLFAKVWTQPFVDAASLVKFRLDGTLNFDETTRNLHSALSGMEGAVLPGFYGSDEKGIKTFSRGGSDVTGALVARALNADAYENWTDVDGVYDANPKTDKNAKLIERLTYKEMFKLAANGANVLHKDAVYPVADAGIPINIRNTFNPNSIGTWIV